MTDKLNYKVNEEGDVVPSYEDEYNKPKFPDSPNSSQESYDDIEDLINEAAERQVGQIAVGSAGRQSGMTDEDYIQALRDERDADRQGTYPGTSRNPVNRRESISRNEINDNHEKIEDGVTIEKSQTRIKIWRTDRTTKERKKYWIPVAYVIRTRDGKKIRLESNEDTPIPEIGASSFLIGEWERLEQRIDNGEGREI